MLASQETTIQEPSHSTEKPHLSSKKCARPSAKNGRTRSASLEMAMKPGRSAMGMGSPRSSCLTKFARPTTPPRSLPWRESGAAVETAVKEKRGSGSASLKRAHDVDVRLYDLLREVCE